MREPPIGGCTLSFGQGPAASYGQFETALKAVVAGFVPTHAQRTHMEPCKVLRRDSAAILQQCGYELRSFAFAGMPGQMICYNTDPAAAPRVIDSCYGGR
jgi:hypothetical protein